MPRLVEVVSPAGVFVGEVGVAPGVADAAIDDDGQQDIHHHAGDHDQKALPGGFCAEFVGLRGLLHLLLVHRLVDHAGDLDITAQRQPSQTVFRVLVPELEEREPGVEEDVELLDADVEDAGHEEVPEFVNSHQNGEAEEKLENFDYEIHVRFEESDITVSDIPRRGRVLRHPPGRSRRARASG